MTDSSPEAALAAILDHALESAAIEGMDEAALEARSGVRPGTIARARETGTIDFRGLHRICEVTELDVCASPKDDYARRLDAGLF